MSNFALDAEGRPIPPAPGTQYISVLPANAHGFCAVEAHGVNGLTFWRLSEGLMTPPNPDGSVRINRVDVPVLVERAKRVGVFINVIESGSVGS